MINIPPPLEPRPFNFPLFRKFSLSNGLVVWYARHKKLPLISARLMLLNGAVHETPEEVGIATFAADMLDEGAGPYDAEVFSQKLENLGIQFQASANYDGTFLFMNTLTEFMRPAFELFTLAVSQPRFEKADVERVRQLRIAHRMQIAEDPTYISGSVFYDALYKEHRYAHPAMGRAEHNRAFKQEDIIAYYSVHYTPDNAILIITGDTEAEAIRTVLEDTLGAWQGPPAPQLKASVYSEQPPRRYFVHKSGSQQAEIMLGHYGIERSNKAYAQAILANQILGGYFLSRLNMNLREDKGYTYGIESRFSLRRIPGPFYITASVDPEKTADALAEIEKETEGLHSRPITEEELEQARGYVNGVFPIAFESGAQIVSGLSNIALYDLSEDYYRTFRKRLAAITLEQVRAAALNYIHPDAMHVVVVGDKSRMTNEFLNTFDEILENVNIM